MTASVTVGRALRYAGGSARSLLHHVLGHCLRERVGQAVMVEVACWFQQFTTGQEETKQRRPVYTADMTREHLRPAVRRAIELFENSVHEITTIQEVARELCLSTRQLERLFSQTFGRSPSEYYRLIRLRAARQLVLHSGMKVSEIAAETGFFKVAAFKRYYLSEFGCLPTEEHDKLKDLTRWS